MPLIQIAKATLREKSDSPVAIPGTGLSFAFNPAAFTLTTSAEWSRPTTRDKDGNTPASYVGQNPRTLELADLVFDGGWMDYFRRGGDVKRDIEQLKTWVKPVPDKKPPTPQLLTFSWGLETYFDCYLQSVKVNYTEFNPFGEVTRAKVSITLAEVPKSPGHTNPTSGGPAGRRTHTIGAGDTLHSIAQREYGKPGLWRGLAEANGIDDPLRVAIGTSVLIPPREDVENRS